MNRRLAVVVATVAAAAAVLTAAQNPQQPPQFRAGVRAVPVYASVRTNTGEFVLDLTQDDFEVRDNGKVQTITQFTHDVQPLSVVVMIDGSTSVMPIFKSVLDAASQFVIRMMPGDRGRIGSFAGTVRIGPKFTSNRDELLGYLSDEFNLRVGNATHLWDGLVDAFDSLDAEKSRRVVLVLSDGFDVGSIAGPGNVMSMARKRDGILYAVALWTAERGRGLKPNRDLEDVSIETGGGFFEMRETDDINPAMTRISTELHNQYVLGFTPATMDGKVHTLEVKVKRPGVLVRARKSYIAEETK